MFAIGSRAGELSLVERVRGLLADIRAAAHGQAGPVARMRLLEARVSGSARLDVEEIYERLGRLRAAYPEIQGVEPGPLLSLAQAYLPRGGTRFSGPAESD